MITHERLKELAKYDPETGEWSGDCSFYRARVYPYNRVRVDQMTYRAARLAWFYMKGQWPDPEIDHRNRDKTDDRWENLFEADRSRNTVNRGKWGKSGLPKGVHRYGNKYKAACGWQGKEIHLGYFPTPEEASAAYQAKVQELRG